MNDEIQIRPLVLEDAASIAKNANNINVWNNLRDYIPHPYSEKDGADFVRMVNASETDHAFGMIYNSELAGVIGFNIQGDVYSHSAEVGYWLGEKFWGRGITSNALLQIVDYAFNVKNLRRLYSGVFEHNIGSQKVLEKANFVKEGIGIDAVCKNGVFQNEIRYGLLNPKFYTATK